MEGSQVKENTFEIRQEIREPDCRKLGQFFKFTDECPKYLFPVRTLIQKSIIV